MSTAIAAADMPEGAQDGDRPSSTLPLNHNLKLAYLFSLLIALLTAAATIAALLVADFIISAALVIGGVLLWRRQALGYVGLPNHNRGLGLVSPKISLLREQEQPLEE